MAKTINNQTMQWLNKIEVYLTSTLNKLLSSLHVNRPEKIGKFCSIKPPGTHLPGRVSTTVPFKLNKIKNTVPQSC